MYMLKERISVPVRIPGQPKVDSEELISRFKDLVQDHVWVLEQTNPGANSTILHAVNTALQGNLAPFTVFMALHDAGWHRMRHRENGTNGKGPKIFCSKEFPWLMVTVQTKWASLDRALTVQAKISSLPI